MPLFLRAFLPSHAATAAYGVLGQAHSELWISDQLLPRPDYWRKCFRFKTEAQRSVAFSGGTFCLEPRYSDENFPRMFRNGDQIANISSQCSGLLGYDGKGARCIVRRNGPTCQNDCLSNPGATDYASNFRTAPSPSVTPVNIRIGQEPLLVPALLMRSELV